MKLLLCSMSLLSSLGTLKAEATQEISININISCPMSEEYSALLQTIPQGEPTVSFEEWRDSFVENMTKLIALVESGKVGDCGWQVSAGDKTSTEI